jgi:hypothetical protein
MSNQSGMDELFGMMKIAKTQQEAVQTALAGLEAEREALAKARAELAATLTEQVKMVRMAIPELKTAIGASVMGSLNESIAEASKTAVKAVSVSANTFVDRLSGAMSEIVKAERSLKNAGQWFAWKWVAVAAGGVAGVCLIAYAALAWQLHQIRNLQQAKVILEEDVTELRANVAKLERKGGRIKMTTCGERLCIEASDNQFRGEGVKAPWEDKRTGVKLVIPRGY